MIYLGIDTSNYTTSVSVCDNNSFINVRNILKVKQGERGLRQSDAVFQHIKDFPDLFNQLSKNTDLKEIGAVGVSTRPRSVDGSYMPVFLAGEAFANVLKDALGVPLFNFSHQDGHIMAGIHSADCYELLEKPFISVHLSGGTCEILKTEFLDDNFKCEIIGGTKDISAGQLIDRVGVKMGLGFPSGKELEKIALKTDKYIKLPVNSENGYINFSGIETKTISLIEKEDIKELSRGVLIAIAKALEKALCFCISEYKLKDVLIVGGVNANSIIKDYLKTRLDADLKFASVELSSDNAVGTALLTKMCYEKNKEK